MKCTRRLLIAMLVLALIGATVASAVSDTYEGVSFHPFTMDADNDTCVDWPTESSKNCDPVNLFFPNATWQQVREALQAEGWTTSESGSTQYLHFDTATTFPQDEQIFLREDLFNRYHMRLWQVPGSDPPVTLGAVHHEQGLFTHTIDMAWEDTEAIVAGQLCGAGTSCGTTGPLTEQLDIQSLDPDGDPNTWRGWANDGSATVFCGADSDGDGLGDACDPCPDNPDCDGDGWTDGTEYIIGTDPALACGTNANPADFNSDGFFTSADLGAVAGVIGQAVPPAPARRDIDPDPPDAFITSGDLSQIAAVIGQSC